MFIAILNARNIQDTVEISFISCPTSPTLIYLLFDAQNSEFSRYVRNGKIFHRKTEI